MADVFVSHVEEDGDLAVVLAKGLEAAGYSTWYYERDTLPGRSYLIQVTEEIDKCSAVVLIISSHSLGSHQVTIEVVRGHESQRPFIPLLVDLSHLEFQNRQPEWRAAVGAAASIRISGHDTDAVCSRVVEGLCALSVLPSGQPETQLRGAGEQATGGADGLPSSPPSKKPRAQRRVLRLPDEIVVDTTSGGNLVSDLGELYEIYHLGEVRACSLTCEYSYQRDPGVREAAELWLCFTFPFEGRRGTNFSSLKLADTADAFKQIRIGAHGSGISDFQLEVHSHGEERISFRNVEIQLFQDSDGDS